MEFEADYFVSHFWSANTSFHWNSELIFRFGLMLERVQPKVIGFDGRYLAVARVSGCVQSS